MIEILHYLKDPKLWELMVYSFFWGNAGFIPSSVVFTYKRLECGLRVQGRGDSDDVIC